MSMKAFAPGRTEIAGNHVDHQHGIAVTGSLEQGISADVELRNDGKILIESTGFEPFELDIAEFKKSSEPNTAEFNTSESLVKGVLKKFLDAGVEIGGFSAKCTSNIGAGMGLSSSAAFELLIGVILNDAFANERFSNMELAQIGQFAEVQYYGKPCGLLDQTAISYGGVIQINFENPEILQVEKIDFSFMDCGIGSVLVDSGADHGDISDMYAAIPADMKLAANCCNAEFLNDINVDNFTQAISNPGIDLTDKSINRAMHYFHEINLVHERIQAMKCGDARKFIYLHGLSGSSSAQFLQNVGLSDTNQKATIAQAICELCLDAVCDGDFTNRGSSRIHGGGFGGCIQVFLPIEQLSKFIDMVNNIYKRDAAEEIRFSKKGAYTY